MGRETVFGDDDGQAAVTMRGEIAVVRHIDKGILTGAIGTCLISI